MHGTTGQVGRQNHGRASRRGGITSGSSRGCGPTRTRNRGRGSGRARGSGRTRGSGRDCGSGDGPDKTPDDNWKNDGRSQRRYPFTGNPGVKLNASDPESPECIFKHFFTSDIVDHIVTCTNQYADVIRSTAGVISHMEAKQRSLYNQWKPIDSDELWIYLCMLILMGIIQKPEMRLYWSNRHILATPIFGRLMSRDRFESIRKMIHFADPYLPSPDTDPVYKLRPFINMLLLTFSSNYEPERDVAVDEFLSLWKGRLHFRVYIPSKRERYGVELFMLCESKTGYVCNFAVYSGQNTILPTPPTHLPDNIDSYTIPKKVVISLVTKLINKGYCITLDNYYNSPELSKVLCSLGTDSYGTLRKKKGLPSDFWTWQPKKGNPPLKQFDNNLVVLRWNDSSKKNDKVVSLLSTVHTGELKATGKLDRVSQQPILKPDVIVDYNRTMGGVDLLSRVLKPYITQRRGIKWFRKIAELLLDMSIYNAFIVFKKLNPQKRIDHLTFRLDLAEQLIQTHLHGYRPPLGNKSAPGEHNNLVRLVEKHFITKLPATPHKRRAQRACVRCTKIGRRRDTRYWCMQCGVALCLENCFQVYHTEADNTQDSDIDSPENED